jgi:predicted Zn-dependent peptidase
MNFQLSKLKNGVKVVLIPMQGVESVGIGVYAKTGSRYENLKINGLSHFLEHMVFKGTKKFPSHRETSYLEGLGAIQNAWTDVDATAYWCKIVADRWNEGLELMKELALNPLFPEKDLEIERGVVVEEINRREDRPDEIVSEVLQQELFGPNSLGMTVLGEASVIKSVSRKDFVDYHSEQYVSERLAVVIAGKIKDETAVRDSIESWFGELPSKAGRTFEPLASLTAGPEVKIYKKKTADQVHFELGLRTFNSKDKKRFALAVLTSYLGQGLSSRLFVELREKRGLCYSVNASSSHLEDVGMWSVYAGAAKSKVMSAVEAVWEEMKRLREIKLNPDDLLAAKEKMRGQLLFAKENPIHQMEFYARQVLDKPEEMMDYDTVIDSLMQVSSEEVRGIASELFLSSNLRLAAVGELVSSDREKMKRILSV